MKHLRLCVALSLALLLVSSAAWLPSDLIAAGLPDGPVQVAKLVAADLAPSSLLGAFVSINGDTALVGAPYADIGGNTDQGTAYIFYRDRGGSDAWGQVARLIAPDGGWRHLFGTVALDGDTAVVGAPFFGGNYHGKAYVYYRNQGGLDAWGLVTMLTASDGANGDFYGGAVAVDGDTIMVGANQWYSKPGAVYVYYRNRGGANAWGQVAKLTASDGGGDDYFGGAVALQGDTAVIAAPYAPRDGPTARQGKVYIFYRNRGGPDAWGEVVKLTTPDAAAWGHFGYSVSLSGDTTVVGALYTRNPSQQGAAYVFYRNQGGTDAWGQVAKLTPANAPNHMCFGMVAVSGDTALVGDYYDGGYCNRGLNSAYIYHRNQGGANAWGQAAELTPDDVAAGDGFGVGVSLSGDTALVGARGAHVGGKIDQGAAYVFYGVRANQPPVAKANGPYDVLAGGTVTLSGAGSYDPDAGDTLTYAWDLDGDAIYGETGSAAARGDEVGATPTFSALGLNAPQALTVRLRVTDPGGLSNDDAATVTVVDATPPVITPAVSGTLGSNNWYVGNVTVSWTVTDGESAVTATSGCDSTTVSADTTGLAFTCSATSAGGASSQSVTVKLDKTEPSANLAVKVGTLGLNGWYTGDVTIGTSGTDDVSGPVTCTADQYQATDTPGTNFNGSCTNAAGLSTAAAPLSIKRDATPPAITWNGGPADGEVHVFGSVPAAPTCTATDVTSGPNGCTVAGYETAVGSHTLTATAYDVAGNSTIETRSYSVVAWTLRGFYSPVEMNGAYNSVKGGSTAPLKFEIFAGSTELTDVAAIKSLTYAPTDCGVNTILAESEAEAAGGTGLRYDPKVGQFIYNWKTPKTPGACLRLTLTAQDLSTLVAYFKLK